MIEFVGVTKFYRAGGARKFILDEASFSLPAGHNYGILGGNGAENLRFCV